ncbi:MAG: TrmH family RNA methyltransferase [Dehalococcoidia bacterium]
MSASTITLIGDGIENPGNARAMQAAAAMFGGGCAFRDRAGLSHGRLGQPCGAPLPTLTTAAIATGHAPLIALENAPGAAPVFGWRLPPGPAPALVAGNERRGIAHDLRTAAGHTVTIPLASRSLNTLNVAAASAVALYALTRQPGSQRTSAHPATRRPEVLLLGAARHVELGSTIRSAGAFGWSRVLVEDRARVWFGVERGVRAEGGRRRGGRATRSGCCPWRTARRSTSTRSWWYRAWAAHRCTAATWPRAAATRRSPR